MTDNELAGTSWVAAQVGVEAARPPRPEVSFGDDGRLTGTTGVNRLMGTYQAGEGVVTFGPGATTRMAGPPELMAQEQAVNTVLTGEVPYALVGDRLTLGTGERSLLLERAGNDQQVPTRDAGALPPA
ncbi:MAG: META domain-containing protein [Terracoccus sp.]